MLPLVLLVASLTTEVSSAENTIPIFPSYYRDQMKQHGAANFGMIWENTQRRELQTMAANPLKFNADRPVASVIVAPEEYWFMNLSPADVPSPLYDTHDTSAALTKTLLLDYLSQDKLSPADNRLRFSIGPVVLENFNGKKLSFRTEKNGLLSVNGVQVSRVVQLFDGNFLYVIAGTLFDHVTAVERGINAIILREHYANTQPW